MLVRAAFHLIDSMGTLEETQEAISLELRWVDDELDRNIAD